MRHLLRLFRLQLNGQVLPIFLFYSQKLLTHMTPNSINDDQLRRITQMNHFIRVIFRLQFVGSLLQTKIVDLLGSIDLIC